MQNAKNGTAWKVKIPEENLLALRSIAKQMGESDLAPEPTTHSLILKAISNYIQLWKEILTQRRRGVENDAGGRNKTTISLPGDSDGEGAEIETESPPPRRLEGDRRSHRDHQEPRHPSPLASAAGRRPN
jgi:hypothetical protein